MLIGVRGDASIKVPHIFDNIRVFCLWLLVIVYEIRTFVDEMLSVFAISMCV